MGKAGIYLRIVAWMTLSITVLEIALLTFPRHLLRFSDLLRGHLFGNLVAQFRIGGAVCAGRRRTGKIEPHMRATIILWDAAPFLIHSTESELPLCIPLRCRQSIPLDRFGVVGGGRGNSFLQHVAEPPLGF